MKLVVFQESTMTKIVKYFYTEIQFAIYILNYCKIIVKLLKCTTISRIILSFKKWQKNIHQLQKQISMMHNLSNNK